MTTLYRHPLSGHAHRAELFLSLIGRDATLVDVDLANGEQKTPEFRQKNMFGAIPVLEDDGTFVADSNAILVYLALKYADESWYPRDPAGAAEVQRWLSIAAGPVFNGPCSARLVKLFGLPLDLETAQKTAAALFAILEPYLADRAWLVGDGPTIADVAGYSYIAHAPDGDISLDPYPNIRTWLTRIESLPGFVPLGPKP